MASCYLLFEIQMVTVRIFVVHLKKTDAAMFLLLDVRRRLRWWRLPFLVVTILARDEFPNYLFFYLFHFQIITVHPCRSQVACKQVKLLPQKKLPTGLQLYVSCRFNGILFSVFFFNGTVFTMYVCNHSSHFFISLNYESLPGTTYSSNCPAYPTTCWHVWTAPPSTATTSRKYCFCVPAKFYCRPAAGFWTTDHRTSTTACDAYACDAASLPAKSPPYWQCIIKSPPY